MLAALEPLLPRAGLQRGTTVTVAAAPGVGGATSLALALVAEASRAGSWLAAVGLPSLGLVAADEAGVALERLVMVAAPERAAWGGVVAALVDGFDLLLLHATRGGVRQVDARRLVARARERGTVLVQLGPGWGSEADVALQVTEARWEGLDDGHGHLARPSGGGGRQRPGRSGPAPTRRAVAPGPRRPGARETHGELATPSTPIRVADIASSGGLRAVS